MSIKTKNRLAAAATLLAVLGLLAAMQFSAVPSTTLKVGAGMPEDVRLQSHHQRSPADSRLIEYQ